MNSLTLVSARRSTLAIAGLIGMSVALYGAPAQAQQSEIDVLRQQLAELQARLDKLEAAKIDVKAVTPTVNTASKTQLNISGLLQVQNLARLNGEQLSLAGNNNKSTSRLRRGELRLSVPNITNNISGSIQVDFAKTNPNQNASSATNANGTERNSTLQEIVLTWQAQKNPNYNTFVDIGQYKIPFGYEGDLLSSGALPTVERGLYYRTALNGNIRLAGDQRDQGIRLRGNIGEFDYNLGVFQGLGERQNVVDYDSQSAIAARLIYKPKSVQGLQIGASYATGGVTGGAFTGPFAPPAAGDLVGVDRDLYNGFVVYKKDKFGLQGEYFDAKLKSNGGDLKAKSYYGLASYAFTPALEGVLRYDQFDANDDAPNTTTKEAILGLNYYIKGNNAKVQANLVRVERPEGSGANALDPKSTELRVQYQLGF